MTDEQNNALAKIVTKVSSDIGIEKDDLVAIKVAAVETQLMEQQAEDEKKLRDLKKRLKQEKEEFEDALEAAGKCIFEVQPVLKALKDIGIPAEARTSASIGYPDNTEINVILNLFRTDSEGNSVGPPLTTNKKVAIPHLVKTLRLQIEQTTEEIEDTQRHLLEVRKRLSQIGTLERQAKAAMAYSILQASEEGRALLDAVNQVKGLPEIQ